MTSSGGENPGPPRTVSILETSQALVEEAFPPETDHFAAGIQPLRDVFVAASFMSKEHDLCALNQKIR